MPDFAELAPEYQMPRAQFAKPIEVDDKQYTVDMSDWAFDFYNEVGGES